MDTGQLPLWEVFQNNRLHPSARLQGVTLHDGLSERTDGGVATQQLNLELRRRGDYQSDPGTLVLSGH